MAKIEILTGLTIQQALAHAVLGRKVRYHDWPEEWYIDYKNGYYIMHFGGGKEIRSINSDHMLLEMANVYTPEYIGCAWEVINETVH